VEAEDGSQFLSAYAVETGWREHTQLIAPRPTHQTLCGICS